MRAAIRGLFDASERISYRRLLAFSTGTAILLLTDKLDGQQWLYLAVAFVAGEAAPKIASAIRPSGNGGG